MTTVLAVAVAVAVVAAPACHRSSSPTSSAASGGTSTTTSGTGSSSTAPTTAAAGGSTTTLAPAPAAPRCRTADLTVSLGPPNGAAGSFFFQISFQNHGAGTCTLTGYPGVSFLDAHGHQIGVPATRSGRPSALVTLAPKGQAFALLQVTDPGIPPCTAAPADRLRVFPPGETAAALVSAGDLEVCASGGPPGSINPVTDHATP